MIDGEIGQVEEGIAHAGVLPVEDAQLAVVQEVFVEQSVVAKGRGPKSARHTYLIHDPKSPREVEGFLNAFRNSNLVIILHHRKWIEDGGNASRFVDPSQRVGHLAQHWFGRKFDGWHGPAGEKTRHQVVR